MFHHSIVLGDPLVLELPYGWGDLFYFWNLLSWDYFPVLLFDLSIYLLDDGLLKLSCVGCLHGVILLEVFRSIVSFKLYGI